MTREQAIEKARFEGWTILILVEDGGYTLIDDMRGTEEWSYQAPNVTGAKIVWREELDESLTIGA